MKSALFLSLAGSAIAAPSFSGFYHALFGGDANDNVPDSSDLPNFPPMGTGSGVPFPFPTASGAPFPTGSFGVPPLAYSGSGHHMKPHAKALHIDYQLAPTVSTAVTKREMKYRQLGASALPSFSLLDPNATPTPTEPAAGLPTGLPTGFPTPPVGGPTAPFPFPTGEVPFPTGEAPFPTGEAPFPTDAPFPTAPAGTGFPGFPGLPTTLATLTRGPQSTGEPEAPGKEDGKGPQNGNAWLEWVSDLLTGGKGGD